MHLHNATLVSTHITYTMHDGTTVTDMVPGKDKKLHALQAPQQAVSLHYTETFVDADKQADRVVASATYFIDGTVQSVDDVASHPADGCKLVVRLRHGFGIRCFGKVPSGLVQTA